MELFVSSLIVVDGSFSPKSIVWLLVIDNNELFSVMLIGSFDWLTFSSCDIDCSFVFSLSSIAESESDESGFFSSLSGSC